MEVPSQAAELVYMLLFVFIYDKILVCNFQIKIKSQIMLVAEGLIPDIWIETKKKQNILFSTTMSTWSSLIL